MSGADDQPPRTSRRRRALGAEERELWEHVTRSVRRLRPEPPAATPPEPSFPELMGEETTKAAPVLAAPSKPALPPRPPGPPPLAPLEPKLRRRLSRGAEVDARLDLHGLTQAAAHHRLGAFLRSAQGQGLALVLVITGKGGAGNGGLSPLFGEGERGVLRRLVPQWLAEPALRGIVVGFETASRGHGGEGALYVRLRRVREVRR
ncbi:Smr/MutS family protein [Ancylobacter defluvii]|uniref:DNA mismatch repair protein MutS n=1 Tax=Ancylobacter defluvii TaxID=1282440 RepID=A0A9W6N9K4_9HYPH|nr:Smr/MutS family protein [Ancylobacter defluvii]MBS7587200.1 Smr/MutS family protein [Ancylobacter defluvii]GLK83514.1 DNA mismatch repair protein MutS [Ancylobacter defluvii]